MKYDKPLALRAIMLALFSAASQAQTPSVVPRSTEFHFDGIHHAPDGYLYYGGSWKGGEFFRSTLEGEVEVIATGFEGPTDTVMDSKGNLFVSNYNSTYISIITPELEVRRFADTPLGPASMAIDESGVVYIANGRDGRIFRAPRAGEFELFSCLPLAAGQGAGGHLDWADGYLYASSGIGAVYRIDPNGGINFLVVDGQQQSTRVPLVSPLLRGCNGLAAAPTLKDGWAALQRGQFNLAQRIFDELALAPEVAPGVWLGLGSLRYRDREFEEAAALFDIAAEDPQLRANASYNGACAHALADDAERAFAALSAALDSGYADLAHLRADPDLSTLHSDPRWTNLVDR